MSWPVIAVIAWAASAFAGCLFVHACALANAEPRRDDELDSAFARARFRLREAQLDHRSKDHSDRAGLTASIHGELNT